MPRKKRTQTVEPEATPVTTEAASAVATAEPPNEMPAECPAWVDGPQTSVDGEPTIPAARPKTWGDSYKAIFNCPEAGFEMGED